MSDRAPGDSAITRRQLFVGTGLVGAGLVAAGTLGSDAAEAATFTTAVPFHGAHQAGIVTPQQRHLVFAAFDVVTSGRAALGTLLAGWTDAATRLAAGEAVAGPDGVDDPPPDTGEAVGLGPSRLTLTAGFGPGLFDGRFGIGDRRPAALVELPAFPGDALDPSRSGGDLCVQSCADSLQVAFHAVHELTRLALGVASLRYYQVGFGSGSGGAHSGTPRNLLGFHDGTANRALEGRAALDRYVWVGADGDQHWMRGGSYLVVRRIRTHLEAWARLSLGAQQAVVGRTKRSGAPLGGSGQFDPPDLDARVPGSNQPVIPAGAHIRRAAPESNGGERLLRRSYSFADGIDPSTGEFDAGLYFLAFQRDPSRQFTRIQRSLSAEDSLTRGYLVHTASAVFACPPGLRSGRHWGSHLGLD